MFKKVLCCCVHAQKPLESDKLPLLDAFSGPEFEGIIDNKLMLIFQQYIRQGKKRRKQVG
jgi:hypothetical protein